MAFVLVYVASMNGGMIAGIAVLLSGLYFGLLLPIIINEVKRR